MTDPITTAATNVADAGIETAAAALETVTGHSVLIDAVIDQAKSSLRAEVPEAVAAIEGAIGRAFAYVRGEVLHILHLDTVPVAVAHLSDADLRELVEALDSKSFDATNTVRTYCGWLSRNVAENAINLRRAFAARQLK